MSLFSSDEATTSDDGETRFVVEPDGTTVDISKTPKVLINNLMVMKLIFCKKDLTLINQLRKM